ncbi:MAG: hypothetical protein V3T83_10265 [Acidobacteriota bacterium]
MPCYPLSLRLYAFILLAGLAFALGFFRLAQLQSLPTRLEVEPNAIQRLDRPMYIEVGGVAHGGTVFLQILQDCDGDGQPDTSGKEKCRSPVYERQSVEADSDAVVRDRLDFEELKNQHSVEIPSGRTLWLRAYPSKSSQAYLQVIFGLVIDPCDLWESLKDMFFGGECDPHLAQALRRHRGPAGLEDLTFEVQRVALEPENSEPVTIVGTRGATGVAWLDSGNLLVTLAPTAPSEDDLDLEAILGEEGEKEPEPEVEPGLYKVPLDGGRREALWKPAPDDDWMPTAPLPLPGGRVAFARQRLARAYEGTAAYVSVAGPDGFQKGVALPYKVHQLVGSDASGRYVLALTLGFGEVRPAFLKVDLKEESYEYVGYHNALYHAAFRSPSGGVSVVAFEDNSGQNGWELVLVDAHGSYSRGVRTREEHDLLPSWKPDGKELAYLAQVAEKSRWR